jgi:hypothetical protein
MTMIVRRKRTTRTDIGPHKRYELLTGKCEYAVPPYYTGYGDGVGTDAAAFISDEMLDDWRANRDELLAFWRSGQYTNEKPWLFICGSANTLPWAEHELTPLLLPHLPDADAD